MAIDWNDNVKRRAFREVLQKVYPNPSDLEMFVDEWLNENLAVIAKSDNLQVTAYTLLKWGRAKSRIDDIFEAFCADNPNHAVIPEFRQDSLFPKSANISDEEWTELFATELFASLAPRDSGAVLTGFDLAFEKVFTSSFDKVRPDEPLTDSARVQELLVTYDRPDLAVCFVECAIAQIKGMDGGNSRNLGPLQKWRDRMVNKFKDKVEIFPQVINATGINDKPLCYGYFLIAIDASHGDGNLVIYPELRVTGRESAIPLNISTTPCSIDELLVDLPQWIKEAENKLKKYNLEESKVLLELFLPAPYLGKDVVNWQVNDDDDLIPLVSHRRFVLRSWERIHDQTIQGVLRKRWERLRDSSKETVCQRFHLQEQLPNRDLVSLLEDQEDRVGLKLVCPLPSDSSEQNKIFKILRKIPVPIILWSCNPDIAGKEVLEPEFNAILKTSRLEHFAHLAKQWRLQRGQSAIAKPIRLLCDCPDRVPTTVPSLQTEEDEETDALVA